MLIHLTTIYYNINIMISILYARNEIENLNNYICLMHTFRFKEIVIDRGLLSDQLVGDPCNLLTVLVTLMIKY